jgi:hypothetical protein
MAMRYVSNRSPKDRSMMAPSEESATQTLEKRRPVTTIRTISKGRRGSLGTDPTIYEAIDKNLRETVGQLREEAKRTGDRNTHVTPVETVCGVYWVLRLLQTDYETGELSHYFDRGPEGVADLIGISIHTWLSARTALERAELIDDFRLSNWEELQGIQEDGSRRKGGVLKTKRSDAEEWLNTLCKETGTNLAGIQAFGSLMRLLTLSGRHLATSDSDAAERLQLGAYAWRQHRKALASVGLIERRTGGLWAGENSRTLHDLTRESRALISRKSRPRKSRKSRAEVKNTLLNAGATREESDYDNPNPPQTPTTTSTEAADRNEQGREVEQITEALIAAFPWLAKDLETSQPLRSAIAALTGLPTKTIVDALTKDHATSKNVVSVMVHRAQNLQVVPPISSLPDASAARWLWCEMAQADDMWCGLADPPFKRLVRALEVPNEPQETAVRMVALVVELAGDEDVERLSDADVMNAIREGHLPVGASAASSIWLETAAGKQLVHCVSTSMSQGTPTMSETAA